jgi:hypothetical protein
MRTQTSITGCMVHTYAAPHARCPRSSNPQAMTAAPAEAGAMMVYSCDPEQVSWDGVGGANGAFTGALLPHLTAPHTEVQDVFMRAADECQTRTAGLKDERGGEVPPQRPWVSHNLRRKVALF